MGFFDEYPRFQQSSRTGSNANRLNGRHEALIEANRDAIEGATVLDIASHDGRWSFAAIKAGASHVVGIEARAHLVARALGAMAAEGVPEGRYEFLLGDVHELLGSFEPGRFTTVFCFGFLYHTIQAATVLEGIARLRPAHLLIDTAVIKSNVPLIFLTHDDPNEDGSAVRTAGESQRALLVGVPSGPGLELMLDAAGFNFTYYDWPARYHGDWLQLVEYREGSRVTVRAMPKQQFAAGR